MNLYRNSHEIAEKVIKKRRNKKAVDAHNHFLTYHLLYSTNVFYTYV